MADKDAMLEDYFRSRALASLLYSRNHADGIAFPSVRDIGGINIAIKPQAFDAKLHNVACYVVRVKKVRKYGVIEVEPIQTAININESNYFNWSKDNLEKLFQLYGMTEDEHLFARDKLDDPNTLLDVLSFYSKRIARA